MGCVYLIQGQLCGEPASGNPPLCDQHAPDESDFGADELMHTAVDALLDSKPLQRLFGRANGFLDVVAGHLDAGLRRPETVKQPFSQPKTRQNRQKVPRNVSNDTIQRDARLIMGFDLNEKLTVSMIKERRRKLAAAYHPDLHAGSHTAMAKLNNAGDVLIKYV